MTTRTAKEYLKSRKRDDRIHVNIACTHFHKGSTTVDQALLSVIPDRREGMRGYFEAAKLRLGDKSNDEYLASK